MTSEEIREELGRLRNELEKVYEDLEGIERRIDDWLEELKGEDENGN